MKVSSILLLFLSSSTIVSAFGVNPPRSLATSAASSSTVAAVKKPTSSLFQQQQQQLQLQKRDPLVVRGGAVPGWAAYNDALDKKPLLTKALTSLVGWFLGDLLAQVRHIHRERAIID
jgi:hypothetical protein